MPGSQTVPGLPGDSTASVVPGRSYAAGLPSDPSAPPPGHATASGAPHRSNASDLPGDSTASATHRKCSRATASDAPGSSTVSGLQSASAIRPPLMRYAWLLALARVAAPQRAYYRDGTETLRFSMKTPHEPGSPTVFDVSSDSTVT